MVVAETYLGPELRRATVTQEPDSTASDGGISRRNITTQSDSTAGDSSGRQQVSRPQPDSADSNGGMARRIIRARTPAAARNPSPRYAPQQFPAPRRVAVSSAPQPEGPGRLHRQPGVQPQGRTPRVYPQEVGAPQRVTVSTPPQPDVLERIDRESDALWRLNRRTMTSQRSQMTQLPWEAATSTTAGTAPGLDPDDTKQQQQQQQQQQQRRQQQEQQQQHPASVSGSVGAENLLKLKVVELRQMCAERGLPQYGRKDELVQRLAVRRSSSS